MKTKKVYKTNKKLLKRCLILVGIIFVMTVLALPMKNLIELAYLNTWKSYTASAFSIRFKLPRAYQEIENKEEDRYGLNASAFVSDYSVEVKEDYISQKPTILYNGGNRLNGISIMVECLKTAKNEISLEKLAENYYVTFDLVYGDKYKVNRYEKEFLKILDTDCVRVEIELEKNTIPRKAVTYLIPLEDKELTVTFFGKAEDMDKNEKEIEKIMKSFR